MTIGLLKPFLRSSLHGLAPVHVGQADVEQDEIEMLASWRPRCPWTAVPAVATSNSSCSASWSFSELAKILVVVDDENLPCGAHAAVLQMWLVRVAGTCSI